MAFYYTPMQMRASSSAFAWGRLVYTDYKSGCLRKILLQSRNVSKAIDSKYTTLGTLNEDRHQARLEREGRKNIRREPEFKLDLAKGVSLSGHSDYVYEDGVDELKSVSSKNVLRNVIKNGNYVTENLAQLVCYMMAFAKDFGRLIYTYYEDGEVGIDKKTGAELERIFIVTIDAFGRIAVDSQVTKFTFNDLLAHQEQAALTIATGEVLQRPYRHDAPFASPCSFCPYKEACDAYDSGEISTANEFVNMAKELCAS